MVESIEKKEEYYVYMLRCKDNTIYTGITNDIDRRFSEHLSKNYKGAKYTHSHDAEKIEAIWQASDRSIASKLEYHIKRLTKAKKEKIIEDNDYIKKFLEKYIDTNAYNRKV